MDAPDNRERWMKHFGALFAILVVAIYFGHRDEFAESESSFGTKHFDSHDYMVAPSAADQFGADPQSIRPVAGEATRGDNSPRSLRANKFASPVYEHGFGWSAEELLLAYSERGEDEQRKSPSLSPPLQGKDRKNGTPFPDPFLRPTGTNAPPK